MKWQWDFIIDCAKNMVIGMLLLGIIFYDLKKQTGRFEGSQRIFLISIVLNALLLVFEFMLNLLSGNSAELSRVLLPVVTVLYLALIPMVPTLWVIYVETVLKRGTLPSRRFTAAVSVPALVSAVFCAASLWNGLMFAIDAANAYHRGPWFCLMSAVCYFYLFFYVFLAVHNRGYIVKAEYYSLLAAAVPPMLGGLVQTIFPDISIAWVSLAFSMLIIYFNMQSVQIYTDHLTGLANRRKFDRNTASFFAAGGAETKVAGIMIDVDDFKMVNDVYGHDIGDVALEQVGDILRRSVRRGDLAARIGGDEFAVVMEAESAEEVSRVVQRIRQNVELENTKGRFPFRLNVSIGYELFEKKGGVPPIDFMARIDRRMYSDKRAHKAAGERTLSTAARE